MILMLFSDVDQLNIWRFENCLKGSLAEDQFSQCLFLKQLLPFINNFQKNFHF